VPHSEPMPNGNTSDMIFDIPTQIASLSASMTLLPGNVLSTGTPSGTGRIAPGDLLEGSVERVGQLRNRVVAESVR
jgi:2-keto-4-pentenoate hydratase/2-oxohepta-3-ene-1,7-dioic acid hydratase in catechol pathway